MGALFGTDGIRGRANQYPMTAAMAVRVGRAVAHAFSFGNSPGRFVLGRDSRRSGPMIEHALISGICSAGCDVLLAGVVPTPAVAMLVKRHGADGGIVISASHNPFYDNGIKLFDGEGYKLSDDKEAAIEACILDDRWQETTFANSTHLGDATLLAGALDTYGNFLQATIPSPERFKGLKVAMDCANGATARVAPELFNRLGADVVTMGVTPDGLNINDGCGSEHPETLAQLVVKTGAAIGLAFDGDGDRLIAVAENGRVISGDQIMAIAAKYLKGKGLLSPARVVSTVMSNMGLSLALESLGIIHETTGVGDRLVMQRMRETGAVLGGENSGHMIFMAHHTTGDGLLTALKLTEALVDGPEPLSDLATVMTVFPQVLQAVEVSEKPNLSTVEPIQSAIESAKSALGKQGRVLVRYSGTQPVCRVMVEGPTQDLTERLCSNIADAVRASIGAS